jgi:hypothetical protein
MAIGFKWDIRPYFTACFRAHMIAFGGFDLWSEIDVKVNHQGITAKVTSGEMPPDKPENGACPEGGWDEQTRTQFLADFQAWKDGGFQP